MSAIDPSLKIYEDQLLYAKTRSELNNFNALLRVLKSFYFKELTAEDQVLGKKKPLKRDEIQIARENKIDEFAA